MTAKNALLRASALTLIAITIMLGLTYLIRTNNQNIEARQNIEANQNVAPVDGEAIAQPTSPIRDFQPLGSGDGQPPILTEFGDFQCPYCARFAVGLMPDIKRDLVDTGMVSFDYRHYPFLGPESYMAAEASECARDQDQFQQYHDQLYLLIITQRIQSISPESLEETARLISLNLNRFRELRLRPDPRGPGEAGQGLRPEPGSPCGRSTGSLLDHSVNNSVLAAPLARAEVLLPKASKTPSVLSQAVTRLVAI